ncbi:hypothetical protein OPQ81_005889 [Rhizoctonia solani]|nr:hypothetical protein OPQ81_005889 [Rhizoctonia solani]
MSFIVKWGREKVQVMVPPDHYPLSSLRETLSQHTGLPPHSFKLVHSGAVMKDDNAPITAYGIRQANVHSPPPPTQATSSNGSSSPVNSQEAATITKIQLEWDSFRSKLLPQVQSFLQILAAPHQDRPSAEELKQNHKKFAELLLQALLRFDAFQPEGEWNKAREVRKGAVKEVQGVLDKLDGMWEEAKVSGR